MTKLKLDGNNYLVELFGDQQKFLDFFIRSIFFVNNETFLNEFNKISKNIESDEVSIVRKTKSSVVYVEKKIDGTFTKKLTDNKRIMKLSDDDKLYIRENNDFIKIKFDSTGNYDLVKKFKVDLKIDLTKFYKNYTIAHLSDKPNSPYKHSLINVVLIPTFLSKFLDYGGILLDKLNINTLKVVKALVYYKFNLNSELFETVKKKYDLNKDEIKYIEKFDLSTINILQT